MNDTIFLFFYSLAHRTEFLDKVIIFVADIFPYIVVFLAGVFLLYNYKVLLNVNCSEVFKEFKENFKRMTMVFLSSGFAFILADILKSLCHTKRPFLELPNVHSLFYESGYAFPSGHATFFTALAVMIFFINKKVGYVFMFFALLIGIGRVAAGVHFPIDILGGILLGSIVSIIFNLIFKDKNA